MHAKDLLAAKGSHVESISRSARLGEAIDQLADKKIGALLVKDEAGRPCGIISERDVVRVLAHAPAGARESGVAEAMTSDLVTCKPDDTVDELMDLMTDRRIRHLPVMDGGRLAGLLSIGDVVKNRIREVKEEADALKSYISGQ